MNKLCQVCGRTSSEEVMQCPACRSTEFVGQPSQIEAYKAGQRENSSATELRDIEQQISDLSSFPIRLERPLFFIGIGSFGVFFLLPKALGSLALVIGGLALAFSLFLSRTNDATKHLQAKAEALRQK
ncbi:MAG: hypothetical protein EOP06_13890 [Proteobacteria bacterium]|nr:MAG: hypothetical protein EOP06_13890 [Pseudomonadota bacterium]